MKTVNYEDKSFRVALIFIFSGICLLFLYLSTRGGIKEIDMLLFCFLAMGFSILLGLVLGYSLALKTVKHSILSSFDSSIKFPLKGKTAVSGKITFVAHGIKMKNVFLYKNSFQEEEYYEKIENEVRENNNNFALLLGEDLPSKTFDGKNC